MMPRWAYKRECILESSCHNKVHSLDCSSGGQKSDFIAFRADDGIADVKKASTRCTALSDEFNVLRFVN